MNKEKQREMRMLQGCYDSETRGKLYNVDFDKFSPYCYSSKSTTKETFLFYEAPRIKILLNPTKKKKNKPSEKMPANMLTEIYPNRTLFTYFFSCHHKSRGEQSKTSVAGS